MKQGNAREFLENIDHQDAWIKYHNRCFFVNGCCVERDKRTRKVVSASLEMYETDETFRDSIADVCSITKPTVEEVIMEFTRIPLIDGKTFWELESELEWV